MRKLAKVTTLLTVSLVAPVVTVAAQRVAPAGVVRPTLVYERARQAPTDSIRPLWAHVKQGAKYGAITGGVLSSLVVLAVSQEGPSCCEAPSTSITASQALGVLALGAVGGSAVGAFFGFTYHFQLVEQRRQRATPRR